MHRQTQREREKEREREREREIETDTDTDTHSLTHSLNAHMRTTRGSKTSREKVNMERN